MGVKKTHIFLYIIFIPFFSILFSLHIHFWLCLQFSFSNHFLKCRIGDNSRIGDQVLSNLNISSLHNSESLEISPENKSKTIYFQFFLCLFLSWTRKQNIHLFFLFLIYCSFDSYLIQIVWPSQQIGEIIFKTELLVIHKLTSFIY